MMDTAKETDTAVKSPIQKFYGGKSIFITGGTGFLGILLIEKLLRTCYDLSMIYLLIRPKKGQDPQLRLDKIFNDVVYDRLRKEVPKFREKVTLIEGDCSLANLGMSAENKATLLREVSIVFHAAASVNFDLNLRNAVVTTVISTKQIMEMCKEMLKLQAVIYVSTAYSNAINPTVEERFYKPPMSYQNIINIVESMSVEMLEKVRKELLGEFPDTYIFSKCITEQIVLDYGRNLPAGLFRPGMVMVTYDEPVEGWVNNLYGAMGVATGVCLGLLRTFLGDENSPGAAVPGDYTINTLIATAWDVANRKVNDMDPLVYNCTPKENNMLSWKNLLLLTIRVTDEYPSDKILWLWSLDMTTNKYRHMFLRVTQHLLPAFFIDLGLRVVGKKPMMIRLYKKIHKFTDVLSFYIQANVKFVNQNVYDLWDRLNPQDRKLFFFSMEDFDWYSYVKKCNSGVRQYMLHEDLTLVSRKRIRYQMLFWCHQAVKVLLAYAFLRLAWAAVSTGLSYFNYVR